MLRSGSDLKGLAIRAIDGEVGTVDEFLFDDERWAVRSMVVNTAGWLLKKLVLLSPRSIRGVNWDGRQVEVDLRRQQVEDAPPIAADEPVSRQMEAVLASYYGYQPYWYGPGLWGASGYPFGAGMEASTMAATMAATERERAPDTTERGGAGEPGPPDFHIRRSCGSAAHRRRKSGGAGEPGSPDFQLVIVARGLLAVGGLAGQQAEATGGRLVAGLLGGKHQEARHPLRVAQVHAVPRQPALGDRSPQVLQNALGRQHR